MSFPRRRRRQRASAREGFHEEEGPEIVFGERLGYAALDVAAHTFPYTTHVERLNYGSVTPISLYRRVIDKPQQPQRIRAERYVQSFL